MQMAETERRTMLPIKARGIRNGLQSQSLDDLPCALQPLPRLCAKDRLLSLHDAELGPAARGWERNGHHLQGSRRDDLECNRIMCVRANFACKRLIDIKYYSLDSIEERSALGVVCCC